MSFTPRRSRLLKRVGIALAAALAVGAAAFGEYIADDYDAKPSTP